MAKPIGPICNLDCTYCYYLHKEHLLKSPDAPKMQDDILGHYIRDYIASQDVPVVRFSWHGGEPTLMGLGFFQRVMELQKHHSLGKKIENDIQTNGTLLDEKWCEFLNRHDFLVGLSIDGPKIFHDEYRLSKSGKPTFDEVVGAFKLLRQFGVRFNTLTVINRLNAKYPEEVYNFLVQELGSQLIQFLPCVEPKDFHTVAPQKWDVSKLPVLGSPAARPGGAYSIVTEWSVDPDDWGDFLCRTFDVWFKRDLGKVLVSWFETVTGMLYGDPSMMCVLADVCGRAVAIERDGNVYSCDHYVYPEYQLGNVRTMSLSDMVYSEEQIRFGINKQTTLPAYCRACEHKKLCNGECPRNRMIKTPDGEPGLNYLCSGWKKFFAHVTPPLRELAQRIPKR